MAKPRMHLGRPPQTYAEHSIKRARGAVVEHTLQYFMSDRTRHALSRTTLLQLRW
jgi:hypothetical protein